MPRNLDEPLRVFIAEDIDDVRDGLKMQLKIMGHLTVGQAKNRIDMLNETKRIGFETIDVYITDVNLPPETYGGIDAGREVYHRFRRPSILFTGIQDQNLLEKWALEEHVIAYILKGTETANMRFALSIARRERSKRMEHGKIFQGLCYLARKTDIDMQQAYERLFLHASRHGMRPVESAEMLLELFESMEKTPKSVDEIMEQRYAGLSAPLEVRMQNIEETLKEILGKKSQPAPE